jgi:hypothetical protein
LYVFAARGASRACVLAEQALRDLSARMDQGRGAPGFTRVRQTSYGLHAFVIVESDADLRDSGATSRELPAEKRSSFAAAAAANSSNACSVWFLAFM